MTDRGIWYSIANGLKEAILEDGTYNLLRDQPESPVSRVTCIRGAKGGRDASGSFVRPPQRSRTSRAAGGSTSVGSAARASAGSRSRPTRSRSTRSRSSGPGPPRSRESRAAASAAHLPRDRMMELAPGAGSRRRGERRLPARSSATPAGRSGGRLDPRGSRWRSDPPRRMVLIERGGWLGAMQRHRVAAPARSDELPAEGRPGHAALPGLAWVR